MEYQELNAKIISRWCREGWEWGEPISHEVFEKAQSGTWDVYLTPTKAVPHEWLGELSGKRILGLASGGGQQIPIFSALGAKCTVLDYSSEQCKSERLVADREGYGVDIVNADMTKKLPFDDGTVDIVFHPVSNCYVEKVEPIFKECYRVLKRGGLFLGGYSLDINYVFDDNEENMIYSLPFNPLKDPKQYEDSIKNDWGIQFSHSIEEQINGQLKAGFRLLSLYEDTGGVGLLHEHNVPSFIATLSIKE